MLELRRVSKVVEGRLHLAETSLVLEPGSLTVLLGPTLSGKTTLLRLMAGLDRPTSGSLWFDGRDVTAVPVRRRNVAMVYQQFMNYPAMTVYENIASPLRVAGVDRANLDRRVREAAELLRLTPYLKRLPLELSGGQQQRTALARAIVKEASLVLLDEPLANLDYKLREELRAELPRIFARTGAVLVYATTEPSEALLLGGATATLHEGRVTQVGPTAEVFRRPNSLITARTFSDPPLNIAAARKAGDVFEIAEGVGLPATGTLRTLPDGPYSLGLQPHHLALAPASAAEVRIPGRVLAVEITGAESFVHMEVCGAPWVMLTPGVHDFEPGRALDVFLDPARLMVFDPDGAAVARAA